jgi:hypothetical protein
MPLSSSNLSDNLDIRKHLLEHKKTSRNGNALLLSECKVSSKAENKGRIGYIKWKKHGLLLLFILSDGPRN